MKWENADFVLMEVEVAKWLPSEVFVFTRESFELLQPEPRSGTLLIIVELIKSYSKWPRKR